MPFILTHFYVAARVALLYPTDHQNETIRDIRNGFEAWLGANRNLRQGLEAAIRADDSDQALAAANAYRNTLYNSEPIAVFSAFTAGSQGPDLWTIPSSFFDPVNGIAGSFYFDLGHYNLSHVPPIFTLERIQSAGGGLPTLQRKYQTAYILGYLTHIALDIHSHVKVNVFATAYFQNAKIWETEQFSGNPFETLNIFNNHNKIEQYVDSLLKFLCFEGYHQQISIWDNIRSQELGQPSGWDFPNYTDYWRHRLNFGLLGTSSGLNVRDEWLLDNSSSLAGIFGMHYRDNDTELPGSLRVNPFIRDDMFNAYNRLENHIRNHQNKGLAGVPNEIEKLEFFALDHDNAVNSQYYNTHIVSPDLEKTANFTGLFYFPAGFFRFIRGSIDQAKLFVDVALAYLEDGDIGRLHHLRNWNLDIGLALRIRKPQGSTSPDDPAAIDIISVFESPAFSQWTPPPLDVNNWRGTQPFIRWGMPTVRPLSQVQRSYPVPLSSQQSLNVPIKPQASIRIGLTHNRLYKPDDAGEIAAYLFGSNFRAQEAWVIQNAEHEALPGYKIGEPTQNDPQRYCIEDFTPKNKIVTVEDRTVAQTPLRDYRSIYFGSSPVVSSGSDPMIPKQRNLDRHVRVSLCRKWVCNAHETTSEWLPDSGNFNPDKQQIYETVFPSEELCLSIFAVVEVPSGFHDLFHDVVFTADQIESLKMVKVIGVNTILMIFKPDNNGGVTLEKAYIDGEEQDLTKTPADDFPPVPGGDTPGGDTPGGDTPGGDTPGGDTPGGDEPPDDQCYCLQLEDVLFRTNSAVFLPDGYDDRLAYDKGQELARGFDAIALAYKHAEEHPTHKVFVTAHTDTVASALFNFDLSNDRAQSVMHILMGYASEDMGTHRDAWAGVVSARNHVKDIQTICKWFCDVYGWDCDPGKIDGIHGEKTKQAIKELKHCYNLEKEFGRTVDYSNSDLNVETWGVIFDLYQREIAKRIGTTWVQMPDKCGMWASRWVMSDRPAIGCSEAFPKDQPDRNEYESAINRRVEILFFGPELLEGAPLCAAVTSATTQDQALNRVLSCRSGCRIYTELPTPNYISSSSV